VRRRVHWARDANGRFAIARDANGRFSREQPVEQPPDDQSPPNADAGARSARPPTPPTMTDVIRAHFRGGSAFDWQRERERYE
jgi:hypothetical protein